MKNLNPFKKIVFWVIILMVMVGTGQSQENKRMAGYRPIWFELNQKYEYGDKYSGALGTYTAKHHPLAIYSEAVDKTFFVYGGTKSPESKYLLCMIGEYDHSSGLISKPLIVCDKMGIDDPHDNPSILIDDQGYIWVFVSGRGRVRMGFKYKSKKPFSIDGFEKIITQVMTYQQPKKMCSTFFNFFTKYTGVRQLYIEKSKNGIQWSDNELLAAIPEQKNEKSGHYQISSQYQEKKIGTFFNRHPNGIVDRRTDLYYIESSDLGETWNTADQQPISIPVTEKNSPSRVEDYASLKKNIYLKDMVFDSNGRPICLYIRSNGHKPGPVSQPYEWCITKWNGFKWTTHSITTSDHNYDMGSLLFFKEDLYLIAPTAIGPQKWGVGGELQVWKSDDLGDHWIKEKDLTHKSRMNHSYVRKSENFKAPFIYFWANGDAHQFSKSELFFGNLNGEIWKLPYSMEKEYELPQKIE
ncbi:MAG: BNR-4 repeat-containing protein [Bacteroidota bacterium]|nr:BNR-4 repeat-containing protein [Bacteroidota bacterium]